MRRILKYTVADEFAEREPLTVKVFYHDKCFDGACSASLFTRFYRERIRRSAEFQYQGLLHRAGALFNIEDFNGDENAIVDFKYLASDKLTWWFDHHESAFLTEDDAEHFERQESNKKFFDPDFKSCTKFLATIAQSRFGFDTAPVEELVTWADIVDGASYESAEVAVGMKEPAMRITMAIEANQDPTFIPRLIELLAYRSLNEIVTTPFVAEQIPPLLERHKHSIEIIRKHSECDDKTIFFDVTGYNLEGYNKFIPYYLHPKSIYSVGLSKSSFRVKISVGSNPWTDAENMTNLAKICERYGGGGHARVGAISFPPGEFERATSAAQEIVRELREHACRYHAN
ncbi:MAG TPA: hypothetical protein VM578_12930 [Candidatus Saccharimonadales bacterium]|nr:hypothetical protein [Candidatus Saccharimonadales bacterium]